MSMGTRIAIGLPLLVAVVIVGQNITSKITGTNVSGNFGMYPDAFGSVAPAGPEDARAYFVSWGSCITDPATGRRVCVSAAGLAPRSVVRIQPNTTGSQK
jgi:hypothetical protein